MELNNTVSKPALIQKLNENRSTITSNIVMLAMNAVNQEPIIFPYKLEDYKDMIGYTSSDKITTYSTKI